jgi:hypothetical protein
MVGQGGALKVVDATAVTALVAGALAWVVDPSWFVPVLGASQVLLGVAHHRPWLTPVSAVLTAHLSGTFLVLPTAKAAFSTATRCC